jgi:hypothetical protein
MQNGFERVYNTQTKKIQHRKQHSFLLLIDFLLPEHVGIESDESNGETSDEIK